MNDLTISLIAVVGLVIVLIGQAAAAFVRRRLDGDVIPYAKVNDCKPAAFMTRGADSFYTDIR